MLHLLYIMNNIFLLAMICTDISASRNVNQYLLLFFISSLAKLVLVNFPFQIRETIILSQLLDCLGSYSIRV